MESLEFDDFFRQFHPKVFRFALASLRDRDAAETVAQECLWRVYRSRGHFRADGSIQSWVMQIAVNLVRDCARNRQYRFWLHACKDYAAELFTCPSPGKSPEDELIEKERVRAIWHSVGKLPERQRTVFLLRFVEDLAIGEIALAASISEGTVKTHLFRAVAAVRRQLRLD